MALRKEQDLIGEVALDENCLYGLQTRRAIDNFSLSHEFVNEDLIRAMVSVKKAAAMTHKALKSMNPQKADLIVRACDYLTEQALDFHSFPIHPLQGGAGTSTNMNVNEVIANQALLLGGYHAGDYNIIHPLDHVNRSQSTNDVYPTALRIAAIRKIRALADELSQLQEAFQKKELAFECYKKLGRTELMDALPITLGQEFGCYAQAIARDRWRIYKSEERLRQVNLGGTAVGTGNNTTRKYTFKVVETLRELTGIGLSYSEYPMDLTQNNDVFAEVSGLLKACAVNLMKISNDLRLMNSGPNGGLGEIKLQPLQAGSTIMPGKMNPVIPEMVTQVAIQVMANDQAITFAAASGQFELNAFLPLIAHNLLTSLDYLTPTIHTFRTKCIDTLIPLPDGMKKHLSGAVILSTALSKKIGYEEASRIAVESDYNLEKMKRMVLERNLLSSKEYEEICTILLKFD